VQRLSTRNVKIKSSCNCKIVIGEGLFFAKKGKIPRLLHSLLDRKPSSFVIITDTSVRKLYGTRVLRELSRIAETHLIAIPPGERSKTMEMCMKVLADLAKFGIDRDGVLILLGGGVVGDLGGFVASIYKRGVRYIQVPTTLLAQIDSSIGGKTGVDAKWGKNQIGIINQPEGVLIDPAFLRTLPHKEILNGIGEMVKYGVISDAKLFGELEKADIHSYSDLTKFIEPCARIKARIVSEDPGEENLRSILNYGHTLGHALEAAANYSISHGIAILYGMLSEGWIAQKLGFFPTKDVQRQQALINKFLTRDDLASVLRVRLEKIAHYALTDKKNVSGKMMMSLPQKIGKMHQTKEGDFKTSIPFNLLKPSIVYANRALIGSLS
jgi:3-dehydroquinate synthase